MNLLYDDSTCLALAWFHWLRSFNSRRFDMLVRALKGWDGAPQSWTRRTGPCSRQELRVAMAPPISEIRFS